MTSLLALILLVGGLGSVGLCQTGTGSIAGTVNDRERYAKRILRGRGWV
jgi:hypothetical protein